MVSTDIAVPVTLLSLSFCLCRACSFVANSSRPVDCSLPGFSGVGCHFLLQGIFPTQGLNPHLLGLPLWQVDFIFTTEPRWKPLLSLSSGEILTLYWASSDPSSRKLEGTQVEVEFQAWYCLAGGRNKSPSSWPPLAGRRREQSSQPGKGESLGLAQPLLEGPVFPSVWQEQSSHCLNVFCLVRLLLSSSLARDSRFSWGLFYVCAFWHFCVAGFVSSKSGIHEVKKMKTDKGTHHHVFAQTPKPLASLSSLHLSESFYVCFVYNVPGYCG